MRYLRRSIQKTGEDVRGPQETPRSERTNRRPERTNQTVVADQPPPLSEARWPWLDWGIVATVFGLQIMLWCFSGEPLMIALRWFAERVGITVKAVLWILAASAAGIGWAVYSSWPKIEALCGLGCA